MNVYDFDGTVYDGESVFDFYLYSVRKQPKLVKYMFVVVKTLLLYKMCRMPKEKLLYLAKKYAKQYLTEIEDLDGKVKAFWDKNEHKIKPYYLKQQKEDDVILSASINCLLEEIAARIGISNLICTQMDSKTGEVLSLCYRETKAELFRGKFSDGKIENFYTDSYNDAAMMQLAERTYLVKGERVTLLEG